MLSPETFKLSLPDSINEIAPVQTVLVALATTVAHLSHAVTSFEIKDTAMYHTKDPYECYGGPNNDT